MKRIKYQSIIAFVLLVSLIASLLLTACNNQGKSVERPSGSSTEKTTAARTEGSSTDHSAKQTENQPTDQADAKSDGEIESFVRAVDAKLKEHWPHMHLVWPGFQYDNHNLILFFPGQDGEVQEAWLLNTKELKKLSEADYAGLQPPQEGGYEKVDFAGKPSITLSVAQESLTKEGAADELYRVASHELVHFYYQKDAMNNSDSSERTQEFPIDKTPRLYRRMIYQNLIKAFENPEQEKDHLGKAKYWLEKWKQEFADEYQAIKSTDIAEATARYAENFSTFIKSELTAEQIREAADQNIKRDELFYSAEEESYEIGYVAALILDRGNAQWKDRFYKEGSTIEEKLLQDVASVKEPMDSEMEAKLSKGIDEYNKKTEEDIRDLIKAKQDKKIPYLKIDVSDSLSSMASMGTIRYQGDTVTLKYGNQFEIADKKIEIKGVNVFETFSEEGQSFLYVPLSMPHEFKSDTLTVKSDQLNVDGVQVSQSKENGRTVYSVKVEGDPNQAAFPANEYPELNVDARPQDDFYDYVNAKALKDMPMSDEMPGWDNFTDLNNQISEKLQSIGQELSEKRNTYAADSAEKAVADLYQTALDQKTREKIRLGSLQGYLADVKAADSIPAYLAAVAKIRKEIGKSSLFATEQLPDPKDSSKHTLFLDEPVLPVKVDHLQLQEVTRDLKVYLAELLKAGGMEEKATAEWSDKLLSFYQDLAKVALSGKERNDVTRTINDLTVEQIQKKLPAINYAEFLTNSGQSNYSHQVVVNPEMLTKINQYLNAENLELLKQYTIVSLLNDYAPYLTRDLSRAHAKLNQAEADDQQLAWDAVKELAEMELGELYAKRYFSEQKRKDVEKIVLDIITAYKQKIEKSDWMSQESRATAIAKLDAMGIKIGYPDTYQSWLKGAVVAPEQGGSLIENVIAMNRRKAEDELKKANAPVDRDLWTMSPQTINAYYDPSVNQIVFPAAILQAPFYDEKASYAQNLGGIGAIIAHEITHAFDDAGSFYDEKGNYRVWWTDEDRKKFAEKSRAFIDYFGSIEVLPGHQVDGELTLGENIADTGGISVISSILSDNKDALKEMFTSYARIWANLATTEDLQHQLQSDEHSPGKVRVNGVLSNTEEFYRAFDVKPGDQMYVAPEKRAKLY